MKSSIRPFPVFFLLFSFSILFVSCSQESAITSPNESKATPMAKTTVVSTGSINHSTDTVITFSKSGKTLRISKSLSADKIAKLDEYLSTHSIGTTVSQSVSPNLQNCGQYSENSYYELDTYRSVPGKHLGIWDEQRPSNWQSYYNNWGFNEIFLGNSTEFSTANNNNTWFKADSILAGLTPSVYNTEVQSWYPLGVHRFAFDEPFDSYNNPRIPVSLLVNYANWIYSNYPGTTVAFTTYEPFSNPYFSWYQSAIQQTYNSYIMCDQFQDGQEYMWEHYPTSTYFGPTRANVGGNWVDYNHDYLEYPIYSTLFADANNLGMNQIWFYADDPADPSNGLYMFAYFAWVNSWLQRLEQYVIINWQCSGTCSTCNWPNGDWSVQSVNYTNFYIWVYY